MQILAGHIDKHTVIFVNLIIRWALYVHLQFLPIGNLTFTIH